MKAIKTFAAAAVVALGMATSASATVIVDASPTGLYNVTYSNRAAWQNFLVPFTLVDKSTIDSVDIFTFSSLAHVGTSTTVRFRSDVNGAAAASNLYEIIANVTSVSGKLDQYGNVAVTVDIPAITLNAGTYWFGVSGTATELGWSTYKTAKLAETTLSGETITGVSLAGAGLGDFAYRISGHAAAADVPEPGTLALAAIALAGLAFARKRKA